MKEDFKRRVMSIVIILLITLWVSTGYYAFSLREKYNISTNNNYTEAFSNLVNYMDNVENYLDNLLADEVGVGCTLKQTFQFYNLNEVSSYKIRKKILGFYATGELHEGFDDIEDYDEKTILNS